MDVLFMILFLNKQRKRNKCGLMQTAEINVLLTEGSDPPGAFWGSVRH